MIARFWEDVEIGARCDYGRHTFTEDEIIRFGEKYDPLSFHIDPEAAKDIMFGGLIASGWLTAAIWMKLMVATLQNEAGDADALPAISPGFEDLKWLKPVRPGMTLTYSGEVIEKIALRSRPDRGIVKSRNEARDENGTVVFSFIGKVFMPRRAEETEQ